MEMEKELNLNPKGTSIDGVKEMVFDLGSKRQAKVLTGVRKSQPNMPINSQLERDSSKEILWLNRNDSFQVLIEEDENVVLSPPVAQSPI